MKHENGLADRILRMFMTGITVFLLAVLLGKAVRQSGFRITGEALERGWERQAEKSFEFLWRQVYPAAGGAYEKNATEKDGSWLEVIFGQIPLYRYLTRQGAFAAGYEETDPAYRAYQKKQEFYLEHEYLFRYGNEETNQGPPAVAMEDGGGEKPESGERAQDAQGPVFSASGTPAYQINAGLPFTGTGYVREQLADYDFLMKHFYSVHTSATAGRDLMNAEKLLDKDFKLTGGSGKPQILIYHTHSQETFADYSAGHPERTVVGMGNDLTELLTQKGYNVIHDTTVYDLKNGKLDRNKAYTYALEGITKILQENPSIEVILDLHRDGVKEGLHLVSEVNGKATAPVMFFNGVSQTPDGPIEYLPNPYREDNLAFSLQMQLNAAAYFPGLTRKIYIKGLRYNLHLRPRSALVEVGAQTNTYEEACNAMIPLAEVLDIVLQGN